MVDEIKEVLIKYHYTENEAENLAMIYEAISNMYKSFKIEQMMKNVIDNMEDK